VFAVQIQYAATGWLKYVDEVAVTCILQLAHPGLARKSNICLAEITLASGKSVCVGSETNDPQHWGIYKSG